mgnify:FL=1
MLNPSKINSWTIEQCLEVYATLEYLGMDEWYSPLLSDYMDCEQKESLNWRLADAYVTEKKGEH